MNLEDNDKKNRDLELVQLYAIWELQRSQLFFEGDNCVIFAGKHSIKRYRQFIDRVWQRTGNPF